tara:strand:- start:2332 stop:5226 length:2895 start_codon:yes stop_codon:yes gene_type:complete
MGSRDELVAAPFKAVKSILNIGKKSDSFEEIDYAADLIKNPLKYKPDIQTVKEKVNLDLDMGDINLIGDKRVTTADTLVKDFISNRTKSQREIDIDALIDGTLSSNKFKDRHMKTDFFNVADKNYAAEKLGIEPSKISERTLKPIKSMSETKKAQWAEGLYEGAPEKISMTAKKLKRDEAAMEISKINKNPNLKNITYIDQIKDPAVKNLVKNFFPDLFPNIKKQKFKTKLEERSFKKGIKNLDPKYQYDRGHLIQMGLRNLFEGEDLIFPKFPTENTLNNFHDNLNSFINNAKTKRKKLIEVGNFEEVKIIDDNINKVKLMITDLLLESPIKGQNKIDIISPYPEGATMQVKMRMFMEKFPEAIAKYDDIKTKFLNLRNETGFKTGGFARRMMAIGGDMSQFTETEEVVSTPNGTEGEFDVAMSFKNPFKFKKPPPLFDESVSNLKISGAVDDIKATETITDTNNGIFTLKSETEIINAPQETMTGGQWLGFLKKKGVSPTELDEFGLGNYLTGYQNVKVKKADLMEAYSNLKPNITYSINQKEPFQKGLDDFGSFLTKRDSGGGYYHGTDNAGVEEIRGLNNKPQDIAGDAARVQLSELFKSASDNGQVMDQGAGVINKVFKQFYGIDNVLKNGIPEGSKIPFYSKTIVERFKRLQSGEGFYMSKTTPRHEGAQFLSGGTGYIEVPITYNPNPKGPRANEPKFTEGGGHFSNPTGNNPVFWMRASERTDEAGRRVLFIEEIQSDLHQGVQQKGKKYATRQDAVGNVNITDLNSQRIKLSDELNKITDSIDKVAGHTDPSAQTILGRLKVKRDGIRKQLVAVAQKLDKIDATADGVPEAPFKKSENQAKMAIKIAINLARENGYDGVVMISGKAKNAGASATGNVAKGNLGFYNNIATKAMKNAAKNNQLDFSSTNIKDGKGNTWAKLPYIDLKGTRNKPTDLYKKDGGFINYASFVDVVPTL